MGIADVNLMEVKMNKQKYDYPWKALLISVLVGGITAAVTVVGLVEVLT
jgi:hypothetical protein